MKDQWNAPDLSQHIAVVAGATRGVGRGIAEALGECGAFVYVTGRSTRLNPQVNPDRTVEAVVDTIVGNGGSAQAVICDHRNDNDVERLFALVKDERGGLDILVNNQIGWGDTPSDDAFNRRRLWQRPPSWWDDKFDAGVRGHVVNCHFGIPLMLDRERAIVLFTCEKAASDPKDAWDAVFDLRATVVTRMVAILSHQLRHLNIPAILLYPGWTRTEGQIDTIKSGSYPGVETWDEYVERTASPHYAGRASAMLMADSDAILLSGSIQSSYDLAMRYGFTDIDGRQPDPT